jgi:hypothetical protein
MELWRRRALGCLSLNREQFSTRLELKTEFRTTKDTKDTKTEPLVSGALSALWANNPVVTTF